jgi:hypothetical protein
MNTSINQALYALLCSKSYEDAWFFYGELSFFNYVGLFLYIGCADVEEMGSV